MCRVPVLQTGTRCLSAMSKTERGRTLVLDFVRAARDAGAVSALGSGSYGAGHFHDADTARWIWDRQESFGEIVL